MAKWMIGFVALGVKFQILATLGIIKMILKYPEYFLLLSALLILWIFVAFNLAKSTKIMEKDLKKGSIRALIFSILGLNFIALIGAIAGVIKSSKAK